MPPPRSYYTPDRSGVPAGGYYDNSQPSNYRTAYAPINNHSEGGLYPLPYAQAARPSPSPLSPLGPASLPQAYERSDYEAGGYSRSPLQPQPPRHKSALQQPPLQHTSSQMAQMRGVNAPSSNKQVQPFLVGDGGHRRNSDDAIIEDSYLCEPCCQSDCCQQSLVGACCSRVFRLLLTIWFTISIFVTTAIICVGLVICHILCLLLVCWPSTYFALREHLTGGVYNLLANTQSLLFPFWFVRTITDYPQQTVTRQPGSGGSDRFRMPYTPKRTLIMCNHLSNADGIILRPRMFSWPVKFVMKRSLFNIPIIGWSFFLTGDPSIRFVSTQGGMQAAPGDLNMMMDRCLDLLDSYVPLLVFPEGTRSRHGRLQLFKQGFFKLAIEHQIDVLPMVIHNSRKAWSPGAALISPACVSVAYGTPISGREIAAKGMNVDSLMKYVRDEMQRLLQLCPSYDAVAERPIRNKEEHNSYANRRHNKAWL